MSALQEILEKGFVDPEVLMQLGDEQKQILFIKMREEQLRKWRMREVELEKQESTEIMAQERRIRNGRKGVQWLCGKDGNVWVWVMGEHSNDLTIEQILDNESKEKARRLAEKEIMQTLRKADDLPIVLMNGREKQSRESDKLGEDELLEAELDRIELDGKIVKHVNREQKPITYSPYDELGNGDESTTTNTTSDTNSILDPGISLISTKLAKFEKNNINNVKESTNFEMENGVNSRELPQSQPHEIYDNISTYPSDLRQSSSSTTLLQLQLPISHFPQYTISGKLKSINSNSPQTSILNEIKIGNSNLFENHIRAPPVPEKPMNLRRTTSKSQDNGGFAGIDEFAFNTIRSYVPAEEVQMRQSKIFERLKEQREKLDREAEMESRRQQKEYEEREQKAKEADESIRRIAQKAREQHRALLRTSDVLLPFFRSNPNGVDSLRDAFKALPRPPKPKSRNAIIKWFRNTELIQWKLTSAKELPIWFHGIITREEAERLLRARPIGAYLVRISERIYGYTVSYRSGEGTKNFLVERIVDGYQFMGTNQLVHVTLMDLVNHHKMHPITMKGGEVLHEAVGQERHPPDYDELFAQQ